jgi:hypothetical protein
LHADVDAPAIAYEEKIVPYAPECDDSDDDSLTTTQGDALSADHFKMKKLLARVRCTEEAEGRGGEECAPSTASL